PIQAELVEQGLLRHPALAHHRLASFSILMLNQTITPTARPTFSTASGDCCRSALLFLSCHRCTVAFQSGAFRSLTLLCPINL
ncbi:MAG: hypothetical protein KGQ75_18140, partial [Sphingomonadales bacterium]|nr:hypothetical protein [Sphingomonadales bacterium]